MASSVDDFYRDIEPALPIGVISADDTAAGQRRTLGPSARDATS